MHDTYIVIAYQNGRAYYYGTFITEWDARTFADILPAEVTEIELQICNDPTGVKDNIPPVAY